MLDLIDRNRSRTALLAAMAGLAIGLWAAVAPRVAPPAAAVSAHADQTSQSAPLMLPVLNFHGDNDACRSWVSVQNVGTVATKTVLVAWGLAQPACTGPLKVECSGLMAPGASWHYLIPQIPSGSSSGILYSFDPRPLAALGGSDLRDLAADYMCERLFFGTVGKCAEFREFHDAYLAGGMFEDEIDLAAVRGQPIVATVLRHCPGDMNPGQEVSASYGGVPLVPSSSGPGSDGRYMAYAYPVDGVPAPRGPFVNVQSMSAADNAVVVETAQLSDSAMDWYPCEQRTLYVGEAAHVDLAGCLALDTWHAVRAVGTGPLAMTVDRIHRDTMASWEGVASNLAVDASGATETLSLDTAFGPLVPLGPGWQGHLAVHVPGTDETSVHVLWTRSGGSSSSEQRSICGGCIALFEPPPSDQDDRAWVRVSATTGPPGTRVDGALVMTRYSAPEGEGFGHVLGRAGRGLHVSPLLTNALFSTGIADEMTLLNLPGGGAPADFTVSAVFAGDALEVACERVGQSAQLALSGSSLIKMAHSAGFVRATRPSGEPSTVVGVRTFTGTTPDEPIPGDETAVTLAPPMDVALPEVGPCEDYGPPLRPDPVAEGPRASAIRSAVRLPVVNYQGQNDVCQDEIDIANSGSEPAVAILVAWGEPAFCAPQCAGPLSVECSGLIAPGSNWTFASSTLMGAATAIVHGARAITLDEAGADPGGSQLAAEELCSILFYEAVGDCDDARRFLLEWAAGGEFGGIPLDVLAYADLDVEVHRRCPLDSPDQTVAFEYAGVAGDRFDPYAEKEGRFVQSVVPAAVDDTASTTLYIQNGGARCTEVVLTYHLYGDWRSLQRCMVFSLSAGESYPFDISDCIGDWAGAVVLESEEPLAVIAESHVQGGAPRVAAGRNRSNPYDLSGDGNVDAVDVTELEQALPSVPGDANWNELADLNADGAVDSSDRRILLDNMDEGSSVGTPTPTRPPEPAEGGTLFLPFGTTLRRA